ncbi:hypothetical protein [Nitrobacter hamburgensis]|uniref:hypothetical protein n=1 Tax=Nitrobacter hamburgensis TaxID=912 RepID=UPI000055740D|nr:hypothetical protein [Nitrobacter hamburgensis]
MAVTARIQGRSLDSVAGDVRTELDKAGFLPETVRYELGGVYKQQQIAFKGLLTKTPANAARGQSCKRRTLHRQRKPRCDCHPCQKR